MRANIIIKKHLWYIIAGTLIGGFLTEIFNQYVITVWIYDWPWNIYFFSPFPVGAPLIAAWFIMVFIALLLALLIAKLKPGIKFLYSWIISWIVLGFVAEIFNVFVLKTWTYVEPSIFTKAIIPYLNFSIFVPILGYGVITGLVTYLVYKLIVKLL